MSGKIGPFRYMSPEAGSNMPYNNKADVYSFGECEKSVMCCVVKVRLRWTLPSVFAFLTILPLFAWLFFCWFRHKGQILWTIVAHRKPFEGMNFRNLSPRAYGRERNDHHLTKSGLKICASVCRTAGGASIIRKGCFFIRLCLLPIELNSLKSRSFLGVTCSVAFRNANMQDRPNFDEIVSTLDVMIRKQRGYERSYTI